MGAAPLPTALRRRGSGPVSRGAARGVAVLATLALAYAAVSGGLFLGQRSLLYRPDPTPALPPAPQLPQAQAVTLHTADGERLVAWWRPPPRPGAPVVLYLHGNGGNLATRSGRFGWFEAQGLGLLAVSWRGYGGSTGRPSEVGLQADAAAAWQALTAAQDTTLPGRDAALPAAQVLLFGESLGTAVAVQLAGQVQPGALVLDSGFSSVLALARQRYGWLPVSLLLRDPLRADLAAPGVQSPVLQVHCEQDPVTPRALAEALHALLPQAEPLVSVPGRCHTPSLRAYEATLVDFIARHFPRQGAG
jgi:pimeloyl-ACP methyl ester carboxylesterase